MKATRTIIQSAIQVVSAVLTIQLAFLPVSFALRVQVMSDIKLRTERDSSMERIGMLKSGSIVEIPDQYRVNGADGKPDLDLTLNNWLRTGEKQKSVDGAGQYDYDGDRNDLFFPVTVTNPKKGSTVLPEHQNTQKFIALKYLALKGKAMIVSDDAEILEDAGEVREPAPRSAPVNVQNEPENTQMEAQGSCPDGMCSRPSDATASVRNLIAEVSPGLAAAAKKSGQLFKRTQNDLRHVYGNFQSTCGFEVSQFIPIVKSRAQQSGVPASLLMSMMTQESSGRCYALNSESDKTQSVGLFQINSASSKFPRCTTAQKEVLRNIGSASRLATGPRCLENPVVNLDESIRILTGMKASLTGANGFDAGKLPSDDLWRMAVSSYNGGSRWVLQAKRDLESFNAVHGTSLSAYKWEDLRIFYMREWLNRDQKSLAFANNYEGRSRENAVNNLTYAENVVGRPATATTRPGLMSAWAQTVKE